ncbi:g1630 [Coccomyxa viridis]|uniref:G1630 protein n=1 Tax=Coccomyxa viridis TaxID=1274662 RepID=A0ABP1FNQ0_9CHLO
MASPPCVLTLREKAPSYLHRDHVTARYLHGGSYASAASRTLFQWTNETANVWTTIVAFLIVNALYLTSRHSYGSNEPFTLLYLSAAIHLPFSICCSLFVGISEEARNLWRGLDIFFIFTCAVLRGSGIAWHVFSTRRWNLYMAALLLDWLFCLVRVMVRRRLRHIPRKQLVWDIAGICTGYTAPMMLATYREWKEH